MPEDLLRTGFPGVTVQGRVEDANAYMAAHHVMVVPLFSAGGMRVKIVEGMAMGRCVISTTMGAEGIECTDGTDILLADTPEAFAARITGLLDDPTAVARIGAEARKLVDRSYSDAPIVRDLVAFYGTLLAS
jgi:glycosyltransferase involved in cell wall biosynthesis